MRRELKHVLKQAQEVQDRLVENLRERRFAADDLEMENYNRIITRARTLLPDDPVIGSMEVMPDANLRTYPFVGQLAPPAAVTERLISRLAGLVNHLEVLLGEPVQDSPRRSAELVLREERTGEAKAIFETIDRLGSAGRLPTVDNLDFEFISDVEVQQVVSQDFVEAQLSFAANAFKGASLLAASVIEGMLLDALQSPSAKAHPSYTEVVGQLPKAAGQTDWDRVSLSQLVDAGLRLSLLTETERRFVEGARDYRDTIHARAEVRQKVRAKKEEAELLLVLVRLIYRRLE